MRIPTSHSRGAANADTAMTPMIDVVFLLLVFFVCAVAGIARESLLATELAASGSVETDVSPVEPDPWVIEVWLKLKPGPSGRLTVDMNGTVYEDLDTMEAQLVQLAQVDATNPVILDIAPETPLGDVIDVYDRCRRAGLQSVNFAADAPGAP